MRIAVIDLGTNTCNLLIAEINDERFKLLHQSKEWVKLGDNKLKEDEISDEGLQRSIDAFVAHNKYVQKYGVEVVKVIATSAVRTADNRISYLEKLSDASGWLVKVVSGEKEAELIFKGVLLAFGTLPEPTVILDIGGGSNEVIVAQNKTQLWKESQPTGMARIIGAFPISDPILPDEVERLQKYFIKMHINALDNCKSSGVNTMIGCSGAFDTIADLIDGVEPGEKIRITQAISLQDFKKVYSALLKSTRKQRMKMKGVDKVRVDLIVPAVIFIETMVRELGVETIIQTDYALREGVLFEMMEPKIKAPTQH